MIQDTRPTKREILRSSKANDDKGESPVVRLDLRVRFGRLGFREARLLAKLSGGVAAPGPDLIQEREEVA
jgi:hypothetical protein